MASIQTHGSLANWQPHLHVLVTDGGFRPDGTLVRWPGGGFGRTACNYAFQMQNRTKAFEATYQVVVLRPYFANVGKRLIKTPRVYFTDTGTLCYLTGLQDAAGSMPPPTAE